MNNFFSNLIPCWKCRSQYTGLKRRYFLQISFIFLDQVLQQQAGEDNTNDPPSDQGSGNDDAEESEEEVKNTSNGKEGSSLLRVK